MSPPPPLSRTNLVPRAFFLRLSPDYKLFYTTPYEVESPGLSKRKFTVLIVCQLSCNAMTIKRRKETKRNKTPGSRFIYQSGLMRAFSETSIHRQFSSLSSNLFLFHRFRIRRWLNRRIQKVGSRFTFWREERSIRRKLKLTRIMNWNIFTFRLI